MLEMHCPLCGTHLTEADDYDRTAGRFHCKPCYPTSEESRRGWIPRRQIAAPAPKTATGLRPAIGADDPMFSKNAQGEVITRERSCECGRRFTQRLLSERFMGIVEKQGAKALELIKRDIPDYFVPVHCPPCERRDLGYSARRSSYQEAAD